MPKELGPLSTRPEVDAFLTEVQDHVPSIGPGRGGPGRLLFGMDATASRERTWDQACHIQWELFEVTNDIGGLQVSLCHYGGHERFFHTGWFTRAGPLQEHMARVKCRGGLTQIAKVLAHLRTEARRSPIDALVFVGDAVEEDVDELCHIAGELGLLGIPAFMFQEGTDKIAMTAFEQIANLSGGVYCRFGSGSAAGLRSLLTGVAVYAAGGRKALVEFDRRRGGALEPLLRQLGRNGF